MGNSKDQNNPGECKICVEEYDLIGRRPRFFPCGHTFCTSCITDLFKDGVLTCPNCRAEHKAFAVDDFRVAGIVEDFMIYCKFLEKGTVPEFKPDEITYGLDGVINEKESLCKVVETMREKELTSSQTLVASCNKMLSELTKYKGYLIKIKRHHQKCQENLEKVINLHQTALKMLEDEINKVHSINKKGTHGRDVLLSAVNTLLTVKTAGHVESAIITVDSNLRAMERWFSECDSLPDGNVICMSTKVRAATREMMETAYSRMDGTLTPRDSMEENAKSPSKVLLNIKTIIPECLNDMTCALKDKQNYYIERFGAAMTADAIEDWLVDGERVFAVRELEGRILFGELTRLGDSVFLHRLQEEAPSKPALTIPMGKVAAKMEERDDERRAFIDLTWPDSPPRRVVIKVPSDKVASALPFFLLCTGEAGKSYAHAKSSKSNPGKPGEFLSFDFTPSVPIVESPSAKGKAVKDEGGLVDLQDKHGGINVTIHPDENMVFAIVIGKVESGMEVMREAALAQDTSTVRVEDCGLVVPF